MQSTHGSLFGSSRTRGLRFAPAARCIGAAVVALLAGCSQQAPIRSLMIVGGGYHDYATLPSALADRLSLRGGMTVEVTDDLMRINEATLASYRVLIVNTCHRPPLTEEFKHAVIRHVQSGGGLVVVHCSLWSYLDWPEWTPMIGGHVETHDKYATYDVVVLDPSHAAMVGLGNRFSITDEPYLVDDRDPNATVLVETAEARHDREGKLRPGPDPQVWVKRFGKGRIFVTTFGHDAAAQDAEPFVAHLHNGIRWAGGLIDDTVHNRLTVSEDSVGYESLFNGRDLTGWYGDEGHWSVENGELVGRGRDLEKCNFLMPQRRYGDFILRFSFKLVRGNSGVQIRGIEQPDDPARPLRGYHVEIVPDKWGSLYDYGGPRQTLANALSVEDARRLVVANGWNDMTIQAAGDQITAWVNGVTAARFGETDATIPRSGVIGFQLHRGPEPTELRLRDVRIRPIRAADVALQTRPD